MQALQLGGPAALVGALVASLAAGINGELAAVAARLKITWELGVEVHDVFLEERLGIIWIHQDDGI